MDTQIMTARRFREMVEAYGAQAARWPEAERDAAQAFAARHPVEVAAWLDAARGLDLWLEADMAGAGQVSERLHYQTVARMIAANDVGGAVPEVRERLPMVWAAGLGLAACLAGAVFGINISLKSLDEVRAEAVLEQTQMIDVENG